MLTEPVEWLRHTVPGFDDLSEDARAAIRDFSTPCSLFEGTVLGAQGSAGALIVIVDGLRERGVVDLAPLAAAIEHSRGRYFANGTFTPAFDRLLHFRNTTKNGLGSARTRSMSSDEENG